MKEKLDPMKFYNKVEELNKQAFEEAVALLKQSDNGRFIALRCDEDDFFDATADGRVPIGVYGVGLDENDHIKIKAFVGDVGYGFDDEDFPSGWVDVTENKGLLDNSCYPAMYCFVAKHIDKAVPWEDAENVSWDSDEEFDE